MKNLGERLEMALWNLVGGEEVRPENFTMKDAKKFLYSVASDNSEVDSCVLSVTPKGEKFEVVQLMLGKDGHILKASKDCYLGRRIIASAIDDSVIDFLNGETQGTIKV